MVIYNNLLLYPMILDWSAKTILVAEDEPANFLFIEKILQPTNVTIIHAENGIQALELLKNNPNIDVVMLDIYMPEMDGFVTAENIRKHYPKMPIIAQTFYENQIDTEKITNSAFNDFLRKPLNINKFLAILEKHLKTNPQTN